jgi:hypothetical protein
LRPHRARHIGNQINAAMILMRADFVDVHKFSELFSITCV